MRHFGDRLALPAVQPTGQHQQHQLQRRRVDHEAELIIRNRTLNLHKSPAELWSGTGLKGELAVRLGSTNAFNHQ
jgi:hypothetical protein